MRKKRIANLVSSLSERANSILGDRGRLLELLRKVQTKLESNDNVLKRTASDFMTMMRMLYNWATRRYQGVPWRTLVAAVSGVIYFVNPLDAIPDFIVGTGFFDDVAVLTWILSVIANDLEEFREWERQGGDGP